MVDDDNSKFGRRIAGSYDFGIVPTDHFDIWCRYFMRRSGWISIDQCAEIMDTTPDFLKRVLCGRASPTVDMLYTIGLRKDQGGFVSN